MAESHIWFTSDLHFGHNKEFLWQPRGYTSLEEHDGNIVYNWNHVVKPDDNIWVLGDLILGNQEVGLKKLSCLNGHIHVIAGNHDTVNKIEKYQTLPNIVFEGYGAFLKYKKRSFYLSHYPTIVTNDGYPKVINLCGHSHTKDKWLHWEYGCYHVELDAHENQLVNIDTICEDISNKLEEK